MFFKFNSTNTYIIQDQVLCYALLASQDMPLALGPITVALTMVSVIRHKVLEGEASVKGRTQKDVRKATTWKYVWSQKGLWMRTHCSVCHPRLARFCLFSPELPMPVSLLRPVKAQAEWKWRQDWLYCAKILQMLKIAWDRSRQNSDWSQNTRDLVPVLLLLALWSQANLVPFCTWASPQVEQLS